MINGYWILAFVVTPLTIVILGWVAALLHSRSSRRQDQGR